MSSGGWTRLANSPDLAWKAGGALLLAGAVLVVITVALPPAAVHSDTAVLAFGAAAAIAGVFYLTARPRGEWILGVGAALGTVVISGSTYAAGLAGSGADDNSVLYLWVCLYAFYFFRPRHAFAQLAFVGAAYLAVLIADAPPETILTRWITSMATMLVAGLLIAKLRRSVQGSVDELTRQARIDSLTGALNRAALTEQAEADFARARRDGAPTSVIAVDVDNFKELNDTYGHPIGDDVLVRVARALAAETRETDVVARVGGDEFAVLLPKANAGDARLVAERLRAAAQYDMAKNGTVASLSVGIATAPGPPAISFDRLWAAADAAMYEAKRSGGDGVRVASLPEWPRVVAA